MALDCKQTAVLVVRINNILDNNNKLLTDLWPFFSLNTLPHTSVGLSDCFFIVFFSFEYFDSFDHYAACWVTLTTSTTPTPIIFNFGYDCLYKAHT